MLNTASVFDSMELDDTQRRVSSRRALALAHHRIESSIGKFLRGARNEDEFFERLALVSDDFAGYVSMAAQEVGYDSPEHTAAALRDHYRLAAGPVQFKKTPEEEQEEEEEDKEGFSSWSKTASQRRWTPRVAAPNAVPFGHQQPSPELPQSSEFALPQDNRPIQCPGCGLDHMGPGKYCRDCDPASAQQGYADLMQEPGGPVGRGARVAAPAPYPREQGPYPSEKTDPLTSPQGWDLDGPTFFDQQGVAYGPAEQQAGYSPDPGIRNQEGYIGPNLPKDIARDEGYETQPVAVNPELQPGQMSQRDYGNDQGLQVAPNLPPVDVPPRYRNRYQGSTKESLVPFQQDLAAGRAQQNPGFQQDLAMGRGQQQVTCPECGGSNPQCPKCHGTGRAQNFGGSVLDAVAKTAEEQNNVNLGGPEPKMDKSQGPGSKPDVPGELEEKDALKPIIPKNTDELKEIGNIETKDLPANSGDAGFDSGGVDSGPHTDTFNNDGQADPVTREALSSWPSDAVAQAAFTRF